MATAYAALTSLMHLIKDLHQHPYPPIKLDDEQIDSLSSNISFFQRFLEKHHNAVDLELEIRIAGAARAAEDLIEAHIGEAVIDFNRSLQRAVQGFDRMEEELTESQVNNNRSKGGHLATPLAPPQSTLSESNVVVGIEDLAIKIMYRLTTSQHNSERQIISISGMGGIGKTTLARTVYDLKYVKEHFDICAWATISKDFDAQQSLLEILCHLHPRDKDKEYFSKLNISELGEKLYKYLIGRRYLVILDDVWDVDAWDTMRSFFPNCRDGRIVITTREAAVASKSRSRNFVMHLLNASKSWDLLCKCVFGKESCPREIEVVGKYVASKCRGLPLAIVVIGGHLAKSPRTRAYWEYIAENLSSVVNSENDEQCLGILSLSYDHLPLHLKPCFLYMGIFPEDKEIRVSEVVKLWMDEGILKPINGKSLEEAAEVYLNDLAARNLIIACKLSKRGKMKSFKIHHVLRDLCLRIGEAVNFFRIVQKQRLRILESNAEQQISFDRFSEQAQIRVRTMTVRGESESETCRLLQQLPLGGGSLTINENQTIEYSNLANVQCLEVSVQRRNVGKLVRLRHDSYLHIIIVPQLSCFLWNLQSLVILVDDEDIYIPLEIWKMPQLRKIKMRKLNVYSPPSESIYTLRSLQCAAVIINCKFSDDLVERVPNVRKLKVHYDSSDVYGGAYSFHNIARLEKLESFVLSFYLRRSLKPKGMLPQDLTFPRSLKKLNVDSLNLDDVIMTKKIGALPLLEVLKLSKFSGREWELAEGLFVRLKYLELDHCRDLECFTADSRHLPCLQELHLRDMACLKEISSDVGHIPTLTLIELGRCPDLVVVSAKEIADKQLEDGNEELQIKARLRKGTHLSHEMLSSASNFHVQPYYTFR